MTQFTANQTKAIEILNCIAFLKTQTPGVLDLAKDQTPMPDGVGTVAGAIKFAATELELPYLAILDAARAGVPAPQHAPDKTPPLPGAEVAKAVPAGSQAGKMPEIVATTATRKPNMVNGREIP